MNTNRLGELAAENAALYQAGDSDSRFGYELLRRAAVDGCDVAWAWVYDIYHPQVVTWIQRMPVFVNLRENADFFVTSIFAKFWRAVSSNEFCERFPALGHVLAYLKRCSETVVVDYWRVELKHRRILDDGVRQRQTRPVESVLIYEEMEKWVVAEMQTQHERVVMLDMLAGKRARETYAEWGGLFESVGRVYRIRENMLRRLQRRAGRGAMDG